MKNAKQLELMRNLFDAMSELSDNWNEDLDQDYPFHKDFEELTGEVYQWGTKVFTNSKEMF